MAELNKNVIILLVEHLYITNNCKLSSMIQKLNQSRLKFKEVIHLFLFLNYRSSATI